VLPGILNSLIPSVKTSDREFLYWIFRFSATAAIAVCAVLAGLGICCRYAYAQSLKDALRDAYLNNPRLLAERARQQADDELVPQATSGWRPKVTIEGSVGYEKERTSPPPTHSGSDNSTVGLKISQTVFRGFKTFNETRSAFAEVRAGRGKLREIEQSVLLAAATAYMNVVRDMEVLQRRKENVQFLRNEVLMTDRKFKEGELTLTDVAQANTRLYQGLAELAQARADLAGSRAEFGSLVGHMPRNPAKPGDFAKGLPDRLTDAIHIALGENPKIVAAEFLVNAARHNVKAIRGELLPKVDLDASYERAHNISRAFEREDHGSVELRMSMPLYNSGVILSRIRQARATERQRQHELINIQAIIQAEVISAWENRRAAISRIRSAKNSVSAAIASVKGIRIEAAAGERSVSDVLDAQRDLVEARISLANAERDFVVSGFTLAAAIGSLTAERLDLDVTVHNPRKNLSEIRHMQVGRAINNFVTVIIPPLRESVY